VGLRRDRGRHLCYASVDVVYRRRAHRVLRRARVKGARYGAAESGGALAPRPPAALRRPRPQAPAAAALAGAGPGRGTARTRTPVRQTVPPSASIQQLVLSCASPRRGSQADGAVCQARSHFLVHPLGERQFHISPIGERYRILDNSTSPL
jgi:hypothetical protein